MIARGIDPRLRAIAALVLLAALAAVLAAYSPSLAPPGLHPRSSLSLGAAKAKVLVYTTAVGSAPNTIGPGTSSDNYLAAQLALQYDLYLQSDEATSAIGAAIGLHGQSVAASGPFTLLLENQSRAAARLQGPDPATVNHSYRLLLDVDGATPILTIYAQAPTAHAAIALVDAARHQLAEHVEGQETAHVRGDGEGAIVRPLGPTTGGLVDPGVQRQLMAFVFLLVLALGGGMLYTRANSRRRPRAGSAANPGGARDGAARAGVRDAAARAGRLARRLGTSRPSAARAEQQRDLLDDHSLDADDWPHTKRVLPWALAGFMAMIFLVPFQSIDLPGGANLDRPLLVALALLWISTIVLIRGSARPRLRFTIVHVAALAFFALCCIGVAVNGPALANMNEIGLTAKKLALLFSYVLFFLIVASTVRPREVPRFVALMVGLGAVMAVATIVEYRAHYNIFYSLWGKVLPIEIPSELDTPDSIGRLNVLGPTDQPLELAALLAMVLPFALMGTIEAGTKRRKILYAIAVGLLLAAGVATSRKTSLVAPAAAIVLLAVYRPRTIIRSLLGLGLVLGVLVHATSPGALGSVLEQLEPGHVNTVATTTDRVARYDAVRPDILSHLLIGRGYGSYDPHKYRILDNEYLGVLIAVGLLGLVVYAAILLAMMRLAHLSIRGPDPRRSALGLAALASVGVILVASALFDVFSFPHVPYLLFFVGGMIVALRTASPAAAPAGEAVRVSSPGPGPPSGGGPPDGLQLPRGAEADRARLAPHEPVAPPEMPRPSREPVPA
ncbi:MAG TPA: hypothetical protein VMU32_11185 [Solirubrobacteraceae bacterium]|nr:hypothetical protein [Solirubrobacteraceae bacterium]